MVKAHSFRLVVGLYLIDDALVILVEVFKAHDGVNEVHLCVDEGGHVFIVFLNSYRHLQE